jgi:hypothetical protein
VWFPPCLSQSWDLSPVSYSTFLLPSISNFDIGTTFFKEDTLNGVLWINVTFANSRNKMSSPQDHKSTRLNIPLPVAKPPFRSSQPALDHLNRLHPSSTQTSNRTNLSNANSAPLPDATAAKTTTTPAWKGLFNFTTRKHLPVLIVSLMCAIVTGAITPVQSWLMGKLFTSFATFGSGQIDTLKFKHDLVQYNIYFVVLGAGQWLFSTCMYANWTMFGDLQARSARDRIFNALVDRDIEWFDQRKDGVAALTTRLQGCVSLRGSKNHG